MGQRYRIKPGKDEGHGSFHLHDEGGWVQSFHTMEAAEAEKAERERCDRIRLGGR